MARWQDVVDSEPEFAQQVRARFDAGLHKFLATLRQDGSPRISGIEATFAGGDLWLGMMPGSLKARDLLRDPRFALHSASPDASPENPDQWLGDAKVSGRAVAVGDPDLRAIGMQDMATGGQPPDNIALFRLDLSEVVLTAIGTPADHIVITLWRPGQPLRAIKRA